MDVEYRECFFQQAVELASISEMFFSTSPPLLGTADVSG